MSEPYHSGMFYHRMLKMFREANKTNKGYKMCEKCKGNHYIRNEDNSTKFCTECNGKDEPKVKETVLAQAIHNFFDYDKK